MKVKVQERFVCVVSASRVTLDFESVHEKRSGMRLGATSVLVFPVRRRSHAGQTYALASSDVNATWMQLRRPTLRPKENGESLDHVYGDVFSFSVGPRM